MVSKAWDPEIMLYHSLLLNFLAQTQSLSFKILMNWDFPGGAVVKNLPANAGDTGSSPGREDPACRRVIKPPSHNY